MAGTSAQLSSDLVGLAVGLGMFALLAVSWFFFAQKRPMRSDLLIVLVLVNVAVGIGLAIVYFYRGTWILTPTQ
jgi:uncharacterized membrane-anchored protein YitT (DUF2179 family)